MVCSRGVMVALLGFVVMAAGCSASVKPDVWAEYQIALDIVEHESKFQDQVFDLNQKEPSEVNKALLDKANARFEVATKHAASVRARLPK